MVKSFVFVVSDREGPVVVVDRSVSTLVESYDDDDDDDAVVVFSLSTRRLEELRVALVAETVWSSPVEDESEFVGDAVVPELADEPSSEDEAVELPVAAVLPVSLVPVCDSEAESPDLVPVLVVCVAVSGPSVELERPSVWVVCESELVLDAVAEEELLLSPSVPVLVAVTVSVESKALEELLADVAAVEETDSSRELEGSVTVSSPVLSAVPPVVLWLMIVRSLPVDDVFSSEDLVVLAVADDVLDSFSPSLLLVAVEAAVSESE